MIKRLSISLLLMGLAAFSLGAAAFAYFSTSESADVSITTGTADLAIEVDLDCDDVSDGTLDDGTIGGDPATLSWEGIVPGEFTEDCFTVSNTGDGDLEVYVKHDPVTGDSDLRNTLLFAYDNNKNPNDNLLCGNTDDVAEAARFTGANGDKGCLLGTVAEGGTLFFRGSAEFPDDGDQNNLQDESFDMTSTVTGYTTG